MFDFGFISHGSGDLDPDRFAPFDNSFLADCGHEVFSGEPIFSWNDSSLCPDCLLDRFDALSITEKADLVGASWSFFS